MDRPRPMIPLVLAALVAAVFPLGVRDGVTVHWWMVPEAPAALALVLIFLYVGRRWSRGSLSEALLLVPGIMAGEAMPFMLLHRGIDIGEGAGVWVFLIGLLALLAHVMDLLTQRPGPARTLAVPGLFGLALVYVWEIACRGFDIPTVLLPPPSIIALSLLHEAPVLWDDFAQTVLKSVIRGYLIGCGAGFAVAILADRIPFLARGLLPFGNLVSAVPIVGIAPIMVMWFGFDWPSKAAVVVVMTFFPMLVNALAGLAASERIQLDLMRSYGAGYWQTLLRLRLPNALPFLFNALKINSTLALIGAIVAEFFGTPVVGMGFRISTEVARMNLGVVWASITIAAITGSVLYGGLAMIEQAATAWHPSNRRR